jgi:hypothetical protein
MLSKPEAVMDLMAITQRRTQLVSSEVSTESRVVRDFDRVVLRVDNVVNEVEVRQGETESLKITGRPDVLSRMKTEVRDGRLSITLGGSWSEKLGEALATSLSRQWVKCDLTVTQLTSLEIGGLARVHASDIKSDRLALTLCGAGQVKIESLAVGALDVGLRGTCQMEVEGQVTEQRVAVEGMGHYRAPSLRSRRAMVELRGSGKATICALEDLDVTTRGLGLVEYYGTPKVKKDGSPLTSVVRLGGSD